jgi:peptidyl-dipeptidase Dcp
VGPGYQGHETFTGKEITPITSNNNNFVKGAPGEPVLISLDDAETLFHEFGHALHGLLSEVAYPASRARRATSSSTRRRSTRCGC